MGGKSVRMSHQYFTLFNSVTVKVLRKASNISIFGLAPENWGRTYNTYASILCLLFL